MVFFRRYKGLFLYISLGLVLALYQNCTSHNHFEGEPSAIGINPIGGDAGQGGGSPIANIPGGNGNGEGYMGKASFKNYDTDNSCSASADTIERQIEEVDGKYYLAIDNCVDIPDVQIPDTEIEVDPLNEGKIVYQNEPFIDEEVVNAPAELFSTCSGNLTGGLTWNYLVSITQYKDFATGDMWMDWHVVRTWKDGSPAGERKEMSHTIDEDPVVGDFWFQRSFSQTDSAHLQAELKYDLITGDIFFTESGRTSADETWFMPAGLTCINSN